MTTVVGLGMGVWGGDICCFFLQKPFLVLHWFVTSSSSVLTSKLVSKAVDFRRLGVIILAALLVGFLTSMVHCMSGIVFGCNLYDALVLYQSSRP